MTTQNPWDALAGCILAANNLRRRQETRMDAKKDDAVAKEQRDCFDHALSTAIDAMREAQTTPLPDPKPGRAAILRDSMHGYLNSAELLLSQARASFQAEMEDPLAKAKLAVELFEKSLPKEEDAGDYYDNAYAKRHEAIRLLERERDPETRVFLQRYLEQVSYVGD